MARSQALSPPPLPPLRQVSCTVKLSKVRKQAINWSDLIKSGSNIDIYPLHIGDYSHTHTLREIVKLRTNFDR